MNPITALARGWRAPAAAALALAALIAGCGGSVGVGGTGSYSSGPIDGFGSIFVGGIEFDDSRAAVVDEDGAASTRDALRLGMSAEVDSEAIGGTDAAPTAVATRIRTIAELIGIASRIDTANGTLVVFDQTVQVVEGATAFDPALANGLASVADGTPVVISASFDAAANRYLATRVAPLGGLPAYYQARGTVQDLDIAARHFRIGTALFAYEGSPPLLADGAYLRVRAATTPVAGRWTVIDIAAGARELPDLEPRRRAIRAISDAAEAHRIRPGRQLGRHNDLGLPELDRSRRRVVGVLQRLGRPARNDGAHRRHRLGEDSQRGIYFATRTSGRRRRLHAQPTLARRRLGRERRRARR